MDAPNSNLAWDTYHGVDTYLPCNISRCCLPDQCHRRDVQSADLSDQEHKVEDQELWSRQSGLLALHKQPGMHIHQDNNSVNSSSHHCDTYHRHHHLYHCHHHHNTVIACVVSSISTYDFISVTLIHILSPGTLLIPYLFTETVQGALIII